MSNPTAEDVNDLRTRLNNYGLANWVGRSTTTPNDMLRIAHACVEALDQFDRYETQIGQLRQDVAIQATNAKTVIDLQERNDDLKNLLAEWLHWFGSTNNVSGRTRRALDVPAPTFSSTSPVGPNGECPICGGIDGCKPGCEDGSQVL